MWSIQDYHGLNPFGGHLLLSGALNNARKTCAVWLERPQTTHNYSVL